MSLASFKSEAQELTIVKMSKFGGGIGAPSKEERLKEAADIHLRLGQIQRYCELMVELGQVWRGKYVYTKHVTLSLQQITMTLSLFTIQQSCCDLQKKTQNGNNCASNRHIRLSMNFNTPVIASVMN